MTRTKHPPRPGLQRRAYAAPYLVWAALFIVVPLILVLYYAFTQENGQFSLQNFVRFFSLRNLGTLWRSVRIAAITTAFCLVLGYPLAYFLSRLQTRYRATALMLLLLPMWMNFLLRTYAWVTLLSRSGLISQICRSLGLAPLDILYTESAVILGMIYNFLPFMVLPIYTILEKMDQGLIEAASDLGCNRWRSFLRVIFPLSLPGVFSGIAMVFVPAISTFEITALLGGNKSNLIGNVVEQQFTVTGNHNYGSAIAVLLMIFLVISVLFSGEEKNTDRSKGQARGTGSEFSMTQQALEPGLQGELAAPSDEREKGAADV